MFEVRFGVKVYRLLEGLLAIVIAVLVGTMLLWSNRMDADSRDLEQDLVRNGIASRYEEIQKSIRPQVNWDDAVANLAIDYNPQWADDYIGVYLRQTAGMAFSYVLDQADVAVYGKEGDGEPTTAGFAVYSTLAAPLVARVRAAEAARGPLKPNDGQRRIISTPIQASAAAEAGGRPVILTASLVQPDYGAKLSGASQAPIVLTGFAIDDDFVRILQSRFLLRNLVFRQGDGASPGTAEVAFLDDAGSQVGALAWTARTPGTDLLRKILPAILTTMFGLALLAAVFLRKGYKATESLIASEARSKHLAFHDFLTGLPNRALFAEQLSGALEHLRVHPGSVGVLCIDLDRFKEINDSHGHHVGDELIREVARRLRGGCRDGEILARLGGDEFAIAVPNADLAALNERARLLIDLLSQPASLSAGTAFAACSIGITSTSDPDQDCTELLRQADLALYSAKAAGRGRACVFSPGMDQALRHRKALESDLRNALADGGAGLSMAYQPQVTSDNVVFGVEALARWMHPERGPIPPTVFVPLAEETGLIEQLTAFTLAEAFSQSRHWPSLKVAVNISAMLFRSTNFIEMIKSVLAKTGADPARIELEITESVLLHETPETDGLLRSLAAMGFSLALDDFGTGYSSLSYLRRYPLNRIKIDRSFIASLGSSSEAEAVVGAIVDLGAALGMNVLAEGVETAEQRLRLIAIGCTCLQGFLFGAAVPAAEIDALTLGRALAA